MRLYLRSGAFAPTVALFIVIGVLFAGCSTVPPKAGPQAKIVYSKDSPDKPEGLWPDGELKGLFARYWALRFSGDADAAFKMEAPHFQEMAPEDRYKNYVIGSVKNELTEVEVLDVVRETEHFLKVNCFVRWKAPDDKIGEMFLHDRWVKVRGRWYHIFYNPILFPGMS